MQINDKKLDEILELIHSKNMRLVMNLIQIDSGISYTELKDKYFDKVGGGNLSGKFAYYLRRLVNNKILTKDKTTGNYYFTRIGIQTINLINNFKIMCREYDLSDLDADGKIILKVVGRKV